MENLSYTAAEPPSLFRKIARLAIAIALIGLALMFSALVIIIISIVGAMTWGYLWWKTRGLRKQLREHRSGGGAIEGEVIRGQVIEGEVIRVADTGHRVEG